LLRHGVQIDAVVFDFRTVHEPTSALDPELVSGVIDTIHQLAA
jgi:ABC-type polar amino acid transport system ATPase subunit